MIGRVSHRSDRYGFIAVDRTVDGPRRSFFFHDDDVIGDVEVEEGDQVSFDEVLPSPEKGPRARNVMRTFA